MNKVIIILVIAILVAILGFLGYQPSKAPIVNNTGQNTSDPSSGPDNQSANDQDPNGKGSNTAQQGLSVTSPQANEKVSSPLKITGQVSGDGWTGFEAQAGTVQLQDQQGKVLTTGILTMPGNWMQLPASFESTLQFNVATKQPATLVFKNENASGDPERDKEHRLDVILVPGGQAQTNQTQTNKTKVKVFFNNNMVSIPNDCDYVVPTEREINSSSSPARAALEELFKGPTDKEKSDGFFTNINEGVKIQKLIIENGTAKVDLSKELDQSVAGSCRVSAIRAQITQTLKQFPSVKDVVISIDGRTEDILQP